MLVEKFNEKVIKINPDSVKRVSEISTAIDKGNSYYSFNVFFKNGKMRFIQSEYYGKLQVFASSIIFAINKDNIAKSLQESF